MVTISGKMIGVILTVLVFLFVLGIITPIISWSMNEDFRCRASVWLTANNVGPGLACDTDPVQPSERDLERENGAARIVAEEMLECHSMFNAGSSTTILDYSAFTPHFLSQVDVPVRFGGRLPRGQLFANNYCFVCSVIQFPSGHEIDGFDEYLLNEGFQGKTYYSRLYEANAQVTRFTDYLDGTLSGHVWVLYSEGNRGVAGGGDGVSSGIVALDQQTISTEARSEDEVGTIAQLCGGTLEVAG